MEDFEEEENDGGASFRRYRTIDLVIWTIIAAVMEAVVTLAASKWFLSEIYFLSSTIAIVSIVMMRWNAFAAVPAVVGGAVYVLCIKGEFDFKQIVIYCVGNCFMLLGLILLKAIGKEKVRQKFVLTGIYAVTMYILAQVGRGVVSMFYGEPPSAIIGFISTDVITLLFTIVVVLISRVPDGIFEDQKHYIIRTDSERRKADGEDYL